MTAIMLRELIDRCSGRLPADVEARARWLVLDTLGCAIAGSRSTVVGNWLDAQRLRDDPYGTCLDGAHLHLVIAPHANGYQAQPEVEPYGWIEERLACNQPPGGSLDVANGATIGG